MAVNPYEAPKTSALDPPGRGLSGRLYVQDGLVVAAVRGAEFPDRCVTCNQPAYGFRLKQKVYWHPVWLYALVLSPLIYVIVALLVRKSAALQLGLCEEHRRRRNRGRIIGVSAVLVGVAGCAGGMAKNDSPVFLFLGLLGLVGGLLVMAIMTRVVTASRIDQHEARLKLGRPFVESLLP